MSGSSSRVQYIEPMQLAHALHAQRAAAPQNPMKQRVLVVDVRDDDFVGGHISGAVNIPSTTFADQMDQLVARRLTEDVELVVVHCMFSQQRGPRCALRLSEHLEREARINRPRVAVLRGGWQSFYSLYKGDASLLDMD